MKLALIVAVAENGVIGQGNKLPWRLPADLKRFKAITLGKPILMGRKTYESIGRPLPGRKNIVISRDAQRRIEGCEVVHSLDEALTVGGDNELMVIGGAEIYRQALPRATHLHLTRVHATIEGDTFFPALAPTDWQQLSVEYHPADVEHAYAFSFVELARAP